MSDMIAKSKDLAKTLLRPFIKPFIERAAFPNTLIEISTNALALSRENAHALIDSLAGGPHEIWISTPEFIMKMNMKISLCAENFSEEALGCGIIFDA